MPMHVYCSIIYIAKIWKQPKCLSVDERIKKMWCNIYIYVSEQNTNSVLKKNEIFPLATT